MAASSTTGPDNKNYALAIDAGDYVEILPAARDNETTDSRVVAFWYAFGGSGVGPDYLLEWQETNGTDYVRLKVETDTLTLETSAGLDSLSIELPGTFFDQVWHFFAVLIGPNGKLYLVADTESTSVDIVTRPEGGGGLDFGRSKSASTSHSGLKYYDFRVYLREIDPAELQLLRSDMLDNEGVNTLPYVE